MRNLLPLFLILALSACATQIGVSYGNAKKEMAKASRQRSAPVQPEEVNRAQTALNDISGPLYGGTRAGLITRVEEGKRQLVIAQQNVVDLQEEGRRARYR